VGQAENINQSKPNGSGVARIIKAFDCSVKGFRAAFKHEAAFRQELFLCMVLFPFSFFVASSLAHWVALISSLLLLLLVETVNSAVEALADQISTDFQELLGRAKDLGSSAVFIACAIVALVWIEATYSYFTG
jgi:diacylglycerol kinase (ATP)